jgi:DegV family protein with EDD domain
MAVKIVTDSTSDISADLACELGITVVPLTVMFGRQTYLDRIEITTDEFYRRLSEEDIFPTTTQPSPGAFAEVYGKLLQGTDEILVLVISGKLSGTYQSAVSAISLAGGEGRIEVIDSLSTAMGLGLLAVAAAGLASQPGACLSSVSRVMREKISCSQVVMMFDTLKYLAKGGRVGKAQGLVGSMLQVKPVLTVKDGVVSPLARLRSMSAGSEYLYNFVRGFARVEELAVEHATTPEAADALAARLRLIYPEKHIYRSVVSPVLGTYTGPNVLSVSVLSGNCV